MIWSTESACPEECPICLEEIRREHVLSCNHRMCRSCYKNYIKHFSECPICRRSIIPVWTRTHICSFWMAWNLLIGEFQ